MIFGLEEIIKLLVKYQANPNIKDNRGNTALDYSKIINKVKPDLISMIQYISGMPL